jgi:DivIVA domain-containing protein
VLGVSIVLFVVLLAVLFAVAAVTAGFGDLMRPVFQDARPVGLPETKVSPDDLEALRFNVVLRGYKMNEVDAVLHRMAREIAERDAVLAELRGEGRQMSFRPQPPQHGDDPTELLSPYSEVPQSDAPSEPAYSGTQDAWTSSTATPTDGPSGEPPVAPAWNPDDYRTVATDQPTEALPGYRADEATTVLPAVSDDGQLSGRPGRHEHPGEPEREATDREAQATDRE